MRPAVAVGGAALGRGASETTATLVQVVVVKVSPFDDVTIMQLASPKLTTP
jgi:hypothetical protein